MSEPAPQGTPTSGSSTEPKTPSRQRFLPSDEELAKLLRKRHRAERRFRAYCLAAVGVGVGFLIFLFADIISKAHSAFFQTHVTLDVKFDPEVLDPAGSGNVSEIARADFSQLWKRALRARFPDVSSRSERRELYSLVSPGATFDLRDAVLENPSLVGTESRRSLIASDDLDMLMKGNIVREVDESERRLSNAQLSWIDALDQEGAVSRTFNWRFFRSGDSRDPEITGIWGAMVGSFYTLLITLLLSFPLGVATAVYLEEFAPRNKWIDLVEVNINNLAAVPSIVFGLLGLAVFLNVFHMPRSAPVVGGLVLALMTLPVVIIAGRSALQAVPPSIREAAFGLGATPLQVVTHHVLPLALPGILTGTIIGMARALGETAPLLMIGMVAFIVDIPNGPLDPATVLPVQVYLWADSPERAFVEKTSAAILCLLFFLIAMNAGAVWLRRKTERRW